ncbi:MAG TPA: hypothetical protein VD978_10465 [Azospirillum sp.]|nr:hypothetical protein [Azospirillum sp.]
MAEGNIGRSDLYVRPANAVERSGSATDRQPQRDQQHQHHPERRKKELPNPRRRRVYDMLFDEIDRIDTLSERQRARIKTNIRAHVISNPPPPTAEPPPPDHDEERVADQLLSDPQMPLPLDEEHIVRVAAPVHPQLPIDEAEENRILAEQLRVCLAQRTEQARKVAVYLHLLLSMSGAMRPSMILDV